MNHEIFDTTLKVLDTDITFEKIYEKKYVPAKYMDEIKKANFLIIPNEEFKGAECALFPETTGQFFEFIKESEEENIVADIAISDEDFQQLELHSAVINVATIIVQWVVFPTATGLVSAFLYDLVKKYHRKPEETAAKVNIIIEETEIKKSKMIIYEGPVSGVKDTLDEATKNLFYKD